MDEELKTEQTPVEQTAEPELSSIEQRALEMGWRPKDEFNGDEDDFIDAKEFVRRKPLFDRIEQQGKALKNVTKALEALKEHYGKVQETEYKRALNDLKMQRKAALSDGDGDRFEEIDAQIKSIETQAQSFKANQELPIVQEEVIHPEFQAWTSKNPWYGTIPYMRNFADSLGQELAASGRYSNSEILQEVEKRVKAEFPDKFRNRNKDNAPDVSSGGKPSRTSNDDVQLTEQERKIMNTLVATKQITKEKYLADLKKIKEATK